MNKENIISHIQSLSDENLVDFHVCGEKVSNRFDHDKVKEMESVTDDMALAYHLYALIADSIFFKARKKAEANKGIVSLSDYFYKVLKKVPEEIYNNSRDEAMKANEILNDFVLGKRLITIDQLLAAYFPMVLLDDCSIDAFDFKKFQTLNKCRERVFNMSVLSTRSLFRSFLTILPVQDSYSIRIDANHVTNGLFIYKDSLFVPTTRNAFSLRDFKIVLEEGVKRLSDDFPLLEVKKLSVLYLVKDTIATITL